MNTIEATASPAAGRVAGRGGEVSPADGGANVLGRHWLEGGIAVLTLEGTVTEANNAFCQWLNYSPDGVIGRAFVELLASRRPDWLPELQHWRQNPDIFNRVDLPPHTSAPGQFMLLESTRAGKSIVIHLNTVLPKLEELGESPWDEYLRDEHALRQLFTRLVRAETRLDRLVEKWPGVCFHQRADLTFTFISPQVEELTGLPASVWCEQPQRFLQIVHEADQEVFKEQLKHAVTAGEPVVNTYRIRNLKTGRISHIREHREALLSEQGLVLGYEGAWLDVTRQTIAEKRLESAAWKETLALVTMGLAHDFGNMLAGIHSLSESFLAQAEPNHPFQEGARLIKQNAMQASQLVQRIVNLHRGETGERTYFDLNEIVGDTAELAKKIVSRRIQVETRLASKSLPLFADTVEFRQVIINMTLNAADAMPKGGKLIFQTSHHEELRIHGVVKGTPPRLPSVCLTLTDTGCGIRSGQLQSIFEPFFTTKTMKRGSGLGLYNAALFVEKHHGAISVESVEGIGTTFRIWLPQATFTENEVSPIAVAPPRRSLLLYGEVSKLLDSTAEFLRLHGYHVVPASAQQYALELLNSPEYQFAGLVILVEQTQPTPPDLLDEIRRLKLPVKTIVQLLGCNEDELNTQWFRKSDLVLASDLPEQRILSRLSEVLQGNNGMAYDDL